MSVRLSIAAGASEVYAGHRSAYFAQLAAPMDDMWIAFADAGEHHALTVDGVPAGSCSVDGDGRLVRFFVERGHRELAPRFLHLALERLGITHSMVATADPGCHSTVLGLCSAVESHTLLYAFDREPELAELEGLRFAELEDRARVIDFQAEEGSMPHDFLESYTRERLERGEVLLFEGPEGILCAGELRRDTQQEGVAQLGLIVRRSQRGRGIGTRMMYGLARRALAEGLVPRCSTEVANPAAQRAIERAGFRSDHRILCATHAAPGG